MTRVVPYGLILLLVLCVSLSGVGVVYVKYLARMSFVELQALRAEENRLAVEWGRLRLEEATLTTHARVEEVARRQLEMYLPRRSDIRVIWGGADGHR
ncbi:cell division protein FtsL [Thiococcus pfennigii]|jgi:cell division protein FtsL|uniref:cell division protein FtsL n=1 Tax=Thiococcus pfennigii TaxID=1057 RepID=UPI0019061FFF|nr:cell division protein FtsL [Thiococcus pfennigii]MBK1699683.1 cell division protein FtsL [Thiococcus pfennigii]MBK1731532.1 cell division protein FtsL [Thiococcus pfennigii]